eukprot:365615-Chlamydomonas_euryale.AAC.3
MGKTCAPEVWRTRMAVPGHVKIAHTISMALGMQLLLQHIEADFLIIVGASRFLLFSLSLEERDPHTSGAPRSASLAVRFSVRASFASAVFLA